MDVGDQELVWIQTDVHCDFAGFGTGIKPVVSQLCSSVSTDNKLKLILCPQAITIGLSSFREI